MSVSSSPDPTEFGQGYNEYSDMNSGKPKVLTLTLFRGVGERNNALQV